MNTQTALATAPRDLVACERTATLVARSASGDAGAWRDLVDRFAPLVWSIVRRHRLSQADAEDAFQGTWLLLLEHIDGLRQPERLAGWLATTARREAVRLSQRSARTLPIEEEHLACATEDDEFLAPALARERDAAVREALATLPARDQALLTLLAAEPAHSYAHIARTLDMPIGSIGPTRARCLERLRRAMLAAGVEAA